MCWMSHNPPKIKIAEEDIPVKKVFRKNSIGELFSPVFPAKWEEGEEKEETLFLLTNLRLKQSYGNYIINYGFHSCSEIKFKAVGEFLHVFNKHNVVILTCHYNSVICDCVIPKGSYYFINENEDYVSNKLKLVCVGQQN